MPMFMDHSPRKREAIDLTDYENKSFSTQDPSRISVSLQKPSSLRML